MDESKIDLMNEKLKKISSDLYQLKIIGVVVIILMLFGMFGAGTILEVITVGVFWTGMVLAVGYLFLLVLEVMFFKKSKKADKELEEKIMRDFEAERGQAD
ncbi:MAG: hypothetical protein GY869_02200 [Planctomycetes bacterium]|nr:hypothetical protein [Planctomycetota bacterium]